MIQAKKKVVGSLNKCYAVARILDQGKPRLLCGAEKQDPCYMFDEQGNLLETVWEKPGGIMTLEQFTSPAVEETIILSTYKFYSPNDSANAKIVYYTRDNEGGWKCNVLCDLPFVHRFGILSQGDTNYLVACSLKSHHAFKDDWTCPGRVWVAKLPEDIRQFNEENQLSLTPILSGLYHNHGFEKIVTKEGSFCLIGTDNGVYKIVPPKKEGEEWETDQLLDLPISDILYEDFDGDGERELLTFGPFHGEKLEIYRLIEGKFTCVWKFDEPLPFLHAIYAATLNGKPVAFIGSRDGRKELMAIYYDAEKKDYCYDVIDKGAGPANVLYFENEEGPKLFAANRETDEIAIYELSCDD